MIGPRVLIGTAGWSVPRASAHRCAAAGSHLRRYSGVFAAVEINSSFYRPHGFATYARWAATTPHGFRFAVKLPRQITHDLALRRTGKILERFLAETSGLGGKRGPLLVQLPASQPFAARVADRFVALLREQYAGLVVCEPRNPTWFDARAEALLVRHRVARAAVDPSRAAGDERPGGWDGMTYFRLHGSPRTYWSRYDMKDLAALAGAVRAVETGVETWVIFDNTAAGAAMENAAELIHSCSAPPASGSVLESTLARAASREQWSRTPDRRRGRSSA